MVQLKQKLTSLYERPINGNLLYLISFCGVIFLEFILTTTFSSYIPMKFINWGLDLFLLPALFKMIFLDEYKLWQLVMMIAVILLALISWKKAGYNILFIMSIMVLAAKNIDFYKLIKVYYNQVLILFLMVIGYSLVGIIDNLIYYRNSIARYSLGIDYPTDFAALVFSLIVAYCYINYRKLNIFKYIVIALLALFVSYFNNARLDTILILLVIPVMFVANQAQAHHRQYATIISSMYWGAIPIFAFIAIYASYFFSFENKVYMHIDRILSGRLHLSFEGIQIYGIHIFGQRIEEHGWGSAHGLHMMKQAGYNYFFIDSAYLRLLLIYGIVMGLIFLGACFYLAIRETKRKDYLLPAALLLFAISALVDQHLIEIVYNPFLIALLANVNTGGNNEKI